MLLAGCSVFGIRSGTAAPSYQLLATIGKVQIRQYGPQLTASVTEPGDEIAARYAGFRRLARYIFGANTANHRLAMTAPVLQAPALQAPILQASSETPAGWRISFYMPAGYNLSTLPKPNDPGIAIQQLPASTEAVYRFSGIPGTTAVARANASLLDQLRTSNWSPTGTPSAWFYDPPWTLPWLRRNEVAVPVTARNP